MKYLNHSTNDRVYVLSELHRLGKANKSGAMALDRVVNGSEDRADHQTRKPLDCSWLFKS
jgi:hypothetical protein